MLGTSAAEKGEECCRDVLEESVAEKCGRRVLWRSVGGCWRMFVSLVTVICGVFLVFLKDTQIFGQGQIVCG